MTYKGKDPWKLLEETMPRFNDIEAANAYLFKNDMSGAIFKYELSPDKKVCRPNPEWEKAKFAIKLIHQ